MTRSGSATEIARRVLAGEVSPVEVIEAALERVAERNPELNAIVTLAADQWNRLHDLEQQIRPRRPTFRGSVVAVLKPDPLDPWTPPVAPEGGEGGGEWCLPRVLQADPIPELLFSTANRPVGVDGEFA